ncbi:MAG: DHH phosphoesterase [Hatfieldvirus porci]|uniref:DHH phosphoesterase n=1 Tax=phage Lak_Megaphage_RVC_JS4_GC31 TaxID=3109228 RepID=A0ABZ0Z4T3_9CAUD|nr:MAG: DHH phosphoesterase [phage Lak_Megaphage_RVC_AP3_GC31]WQJ53089.1 MAG: DHH phosphoesterase [phage Lak_Megaphage_RVC_JS4_GC31]
MNEKYLIIYHKEDNDGLFSMAIVYNYLVNDERVAKDNIRLFGADYNDLEKLSLDDDIISDSDYIYITDVSFNTVEKMIQLKEMFKENLVWIDHHKPMIENSVKKGFNDINGIRDTKHSALYNVFKYLYKDDKKMPEILKILSAWDSWSYEDEGYEFDLCRYVNIGVNNKYNLKTDEIIHYVYVLLYDPELISLYESIDELESIGKFECDVFDRIYENNINMYGDFSWTVNGRSACALFIQGPSNSQIFKTCKDKVQNGIIFKRLNDSNWVLSLYNTDNQHDFHCGEYLKKYFNGGGHEGAAGCQISEDKFIEILKKKSI